MGKFFVIARKNFIFAKKIFFYSWQEIFFIAAKKFSCKENFFYKSVHVLIEIFFCLQENVFL